jgi:transcriptional regulator with XRE-family HTH domain
MQTQEHLQEHELGNLLRYWRHERGKSQLDLSLDSGISQRHLSFVESGRSVPSRDLLLIVSEKLDIPLRERNVLLLASGYAPIYEESSWEVPEMAAVTRHASSAPLLTWKRDRDRATCSISCFIPRECGHWSKIGKLWRLDFYRGFIANVSAIFWIKRQWNYRGSSKSIRVYSTISASREAEARRFAAILGVVAV